VQYRNPLRVSVRFSACQRRGCEEVAITGRPFCPQHSQPTYKQSETVNPRLAARNDLILKGETYVYAIDGGDLVKIGKANDVAGRFSSLQSGSPIQLVLLGSIRGPRSLEKQIHAWAKEHIARGEWFRKTSPVMDIVRLIVDGDLDRLLTKIRF
jgi:hypothetical protein